MLSPSPTSWEPGVLGLQTGDGFTPIVVASGTIGSCGNARARVPGAVPYIDPNTNMANHLTSMGTSLLFFLPCVSVGFGIRFRVVRRSADSSTHYIEWGKREAAKLVITLPETKMKRKETSPPDGENAHPNSSESGSAVSVANLASFYESKCSPLGAQERNGLASRAA
ncbi:hypothetical protein THAOC_26027 [Thalassiosira oceanica]|uniref:Uncharacterized protein n=1 Tax=Thalassiosira oceanica TaxID=159749 RepID=K0RKV1_THAOC|nr:hypothetical protein THAOC_26027 [Thalassiosira oceanica]|eukprot:EJK54353.1 hypothetical protein THAOC_26027 [Thalassiosira oceanica]